LAVALRLVGVAVPAMEGVEKAGLVGWVNRHARESQLLKVVHTGGGKSGNQRRTHETISEINGHGVGGQSVTQALVSLQNKRSSAVASSNLRRSRSLLNRGEEIVSDPQAREGGDCLQGTDQTAVEVDQRASSEAQELRRGHD
jgi:hypothetical protein